MCVWARTEEPKITNKLSSLHEFRALGSDLTEHLLNSRLESIKL